MEISALGMDIAKSVFQVHGATKSGRAVLQKRLYRSDVIEFVKQLPRCLIALEACSGAHHWAREFRKSGHDVRLISPKFVKPYVKSNKNDRADAEAICEAVSRESMRFVPIKTIEQQDVLSLHRIRERLVRSRTALSNEIRGLLNEHGIIFARGIAKLPQELPLLLENYRERLTPLSLETFTELLAEFRCIQERIKFYERRIEAFAKSHPVCRRLMSIPGVGPLTATAVISAVGDPASFKNGRQFSAWLGLVPRQHSSGGKERLLGISKRGDRYLRTLLIHGARSTIRHVGKREDKRSAWIKSLIGRRGLHRTTVALANKNARIIWALMTHEEAEYKASWISRAA